MSKYAIFGILLAIAVSLTLVACGGDGTEEKVGDRDSTDLQEGGFAFPTPAPAATPAPAPPAVMPAPGLPPLPDEFRSSVGALESAQRQVISTASLSVEVEEVQGAVAQVRVIAESLGGFVEQLSSSGSAEHQRATMTIRVPQDQFFTALERIQSLGELLNENVGSEDVTEQFIDLEARLNSLMREEQSLLSLLDKADTVSDILTIERELSRIRTEIEQLQGRLNFLERRVEFASISVFLSTPMPEVAEPPSASLSVEVSDVTGSLEQVKAQAAALNWGVDKVFLSVREGKERADISLRVFPSGFEQALASIEEHGTVLSKELREGAGASDVDEEPNAPIIVSFLEKEDSSSTGLIVAIVAPIGSIAFAAVLATVVYLTYRAGRRRGS